MKYGIKFGMIVIATVFLSKSAFAAATLRVAAASDLRYALDDLEKKFEKANDGIKLDVTFGSSGSFYQQIQKGAKFDLFLSADASFPEKLVREGLAEGQPFRYGSGRLVIWARNDEKLDFKEGDGLKNLLNPQIKKISIANPAHAPYGMAAEKALTQSKLEGELKKKLVIADSVAQAAQYAQTSAANTGLIALALAKSPALAKVGHYVMVHEAPPLNQSGMILKSSEQKVNAAKLQAFLLSADSQATLHEFGFENAAPNSPSVKK